MSGEFLKKFTSEQKMLFELRYTVFTDGSCNDKKTGGWAAVIMDSKNKKTVISGKVDDTTNNKMELTAIIEALEWILGKYDDTLKQHVQVNMHSDSKYCVNSLREWIAEWQKTDFLLPGTDSQERPNTELLKRAYQLSKMCKFSIKWIPRNSCDNSKKADEMCKDARQSM